MRIQNSSAQKSSETENAPIQDQYFIFAVSIGYTHFCLIHCVETFSTLYCWCIGKSVLPKMSRCKRNGNKNGDNYCFCWSSSSNNSINACCCWVSFQDSGTVFTHSPFFDSRTVSPEWHVGKEVCCESWTTMSTPRLSRSTVQSRPKTALSPGKPQAMLCVSSQGPDVVPGFQTALLTSYNRHHLSFKHQQSVQLIIRWDKS